MNKKAFKLNSHTFILPPSSFILSLCWNGRVKLVCEVRVEGA
jgi:hypothetical protein